MPGAATLDTAIGRALGRFIQPVLSLCVSAGQPSQAQTADILRQRRKLALAMPTEPLNFESEEAPWRKKAAPLAGIYAAARA